MSKIAIITDTHFGVRNDNNSILDYMEIFFEKQFFPFLEENEIKTVIIPGDLVDRRKYININTSKRMREMFLDKLEKYDTHYLAGNHDCYFKNTNQSNIFNEILPKHPNVYIGPKEIELYGTKILFLPWICDDNYEESMNIIKKTKAQICIGHLEINGFEMHKGSFCDHGLDMKILNKFDIVLSGHFHHRSTKGNITYLGTPYQMTWSDYGDNKGFHIFDTKDRSLTFIQNPFEIFQKIVYNDTKINDINDILNFKEERFRGTYVKIIIQEKTNPYWFDLLVDKIEKSGALSVQFVDDKFNLNIDEDNFEMAEDTITILKKYIDQLSLQIDKTKLDNLFVSLYNEASNLKV